MKTVKKVLDILEVFLDNREEHGISELVEITGQNISTVHSILQELARRGYIRQKQKRGKYSLGLKFLSFSNTLNKIMTIEDIVHPFIVELSKEVNETVNLAVLDGNHATNIAIIHSIHKLRVVMDQSVGLPLYCTGVGKVFLAGMTDEDLDQYLKNEKLIANTLKTITAGVKLKNQIRKIRRIGIAYDNEEHEIGIRNVAVPVRDGNGKITLAVGVQGPSVRLSLKRAKQIAPIIKKYATAISELLGYHESDFS
ncbi:MAG: hypothetical protein A2144_02280 [Chloroflexi bacterium RBG_16_50_9]|nr:MAG: hypothetical protein A2144_02280 [Chloroflexi bacterium RBG_16_50_9]